MAWRYEERDQSVVIDGFDKGIADDPYQGIADARNVNVISIPNEASVGFATAKISSPAISNVSVTSATTGTGTSLISFPGGAVGLENGVAIRFTSISVGGLTAGTAVYWVGTPSGSPPSSCALYSDFEQTNQVTMTSTGTGTFLVYSPNFSTYQGTQPQKFTSSATTGYNYLVDSLGRVWSDRSTTTSGYWKFMGNAGHLTSDQSNGNGIVYYKPTGANGYVFVFSDSSIDYFQEVVPIVWKYGWNPSDGSLNNASRYLNAGAASGASHEALVGQDNTVYYCDANYVGSFFEKVGSTFIPTNLATYTFAPQALTLPTIEQATCLAELGVSLLVGGVRNFVYPWDRTSTSFRYPILLAESVIQKMLTVNTNTFIFTGNRGRIYVTNGSQAQLWKKIPDHLSGTVEPYYRWGGVSFGKNQMYFSMLGTKNDGTSLSTYGGIWAIDFDTLALRCVNQLSYGTYAGYAPALTFIPGNQSGSGLRSGWDSGASTYGIDGSISTPYTGSQAYVDSDLIPIGTLNMPRDGQQLEFKLATPLVAGESVTLYTRTDFASSFGTVTYLTTPTTGDFSGTAPVNFAKAQWLQIRGVLNSTATNPSYVRFREMRITGLGK